MSKFYFYVYVIRLHSVIKTIAEHYGRTLMKLSSAIKLNKSIYFYILFLSSIYINRFSF